MISSALNNFAAADIKSYDNNAHFIFGIIVISKTFLLLRTICGEFLVTLK